MPTEPKRDKPLQDKVIVISHAARGVNQAVATHLANLGASLALIDSDEQKLIQSAADIALINENVQGYCVDVRDAELIPDTFAYIAEDFGRIDALVCNSGILNDSDILHMIGKGQVEKSSIANKINVNENGTFLLGQASAAIMASLGTGGKLICLSSIANKETLKQLPLNIERGLLNAMFESWSQELGEFDIETILLDCAMVSADGGESLSDNQREALLEALPLSMHMHYNDIALTVERALLEAKNGDVLVAQGQKPH